MVATIDAAGRIVVPKPLREALGLTPGMRLELTDHDGILLVRPAPVPMRLVHHGRTMAIEPEEPLPTLTAAEVRDVLESARK